GRRGRGGSRLAKQPLEEARRRAGYSGAARPGLAADSPATDPVAREMLARRKQKLPGQARRRELARVAQDIGLVCLTCAVRPECPESRSCTDPRGFSPSIGA